MNPIETYLSEMYHIRSSGAAVKETSYYPTLANLFNEIGKQLKPQVTCIISVRNQGAGLPDGGFFTSDQFQRGSPTDWIPSTIPSRGVIEIKGTADDAWLTAEGEQISKYWGKYHQVLVTNYRDFLLIGQDASGKPIKLESFRFADNDDAFWIAVASPRKTVGRLGDRFINYLKRVMLHAAPLSDPQDVAWFLASYAREAKARIDAQELSLLDGVRNALEESLGLKFEGVKGEHFFRSTLVQTLFYGVFSAWVLWSKQLSKTDDQSRFDWKSAAWSLRLPMIRELFEQVASPSKLGPLGLAEVLDWTGATLNRVDRNAFFGSFEEQQIVQYFYEPFLEAFDPDLRKELGVWYTPHEIVEYTVKRVDRVLRDELGIENGLADSRVLVLDPCCGTGSYLVEVLRHIVQALRDKGNDALVPSDVKRAALERVFGFEILPAPFIVAHLQIGLLLQNLGAEISDYKKERAGVFLTNALTGWKAPDSVQRILYFPEMEKEREESHLIKHEKPILVVLGNPPYNAFAGVSPSEELGLVEPYKEGLISVWGIKKFNLDDLYIRFFRLAERRIAEMTGKGVICYISNFSYLGEPSYVVMRKRLLDEFDKIWIDCMNGSSRETGKLTPDGKPDPSVFSTKYNPEGIRVGTAISLLVRKSDNPKGATVLFRHFWGVNKRGDLLNSLGFEDFGSHYQLASPITQTRFSFRPSQALTEYLRWPTVLELSEIGALNGPIERRGGSFIAFRSDAGKLSALNQYLDPTYNNDQIKALAPRLMISSGEFKAEKTRGLLLKKKVKYDPTKIIRYSFKPFDVRLAYLDSAIQPLFSRPSPELLRCRNIPNNGFVISRDTADKSPEGPPLYYSQLVCDYSCISGGARHIPIWRRTESVRVKKKGKKNSGPPHSNQATLSGEPVRGSEPFKANLSASARNYLQTIGIPDIDSDPRSADLIWMHVLALGFSPAYLSDNADGIREGWPRVPLAKTLKALVISAQLGRQLAALLDTESEAPSVTSGVIRPELETIGVISRVGGGALNPDSEDLRVTARWGYGTEVVMPGAGHIIKRDYTSEELGGIKYGALRNGVELEEFLSALGDTTYDVYLNDVAYWKNIPLRVWEYTLGGYQVIKKWLSYRAYDVMGRSITSEEAREMTNMSRRIASILLLETALDANYMRTKAEPYQWEPTTIH